MRPSRARRPGTRARSGRRCARRNGAPCKRSVTERTPSRQPRPDQWLGSCPRCPRHRASGRPLSRRGASAAQAAGSPSRCCCPCPPRVRYGGKRSPRTRAGATTSLRPCPRRRKSCRLRRSEDWRCSRSKWPITRRGTTRRAAETENGCGRRWRPVLFRIARQLRPSRWANRPSTHCPLWTPSSRWRERESANSSRQWTACWSCGLHACSPPAS
mmetsp:Transcript_12494/g.31641  ORF Transcript_12494/g.31641 Transcript_12494/m.31641 type:complete len:214 (+) Transcript_12494:142-783(+)